MSSEFIGVLPAAGIGTRLAPFRYPKELLPILYETRPGPTEERRPRVISEFSLESFAIADVRKCFIIIAPWKLDVMQYFSDGADFRLDIAYLYQETARGLPYALDLAYPWTKDCQVVFAMPDTLIYPRECLAQLRSFYLQTHTDLALGVFPTEEAARLGPVILDGETVVEVVDKCPHPPVQNTWGVAIWGPAFSRLLHTELARFGAQSGEPVIGGYFDLAVRRGLSVRAMLFSEGAFADIGTPQGIHRCFELLTKEGNEI